MILVTLEQYTSEIILGKVKAVRKQLVEREESTRSIDILIAALHATDYEEVHEYLSSAFYWYETPEGFDFWSEYADLLEDHLT